LKLEEAESIASSDGDSDNLQSIIIQGTQYSMDSDMNVYEETEEGYIQIGTYNSVTDSLVRLTDEEDTEDVEGEVEEEEEEQPDLEQFTWKGTTYYRDAENLVYQETDDGYEQIGSWNGKKVVLDDQ
jgi:uncharacterized protein YhfF